MWDAAAALASVPRRSRRLPFLPAGFRGVDVLGQPGETDAEADELVAVAALVLGILVQAQHRMQHAPRLRRIVPAHGRALVVADAALAEVEEVDVVVPGEALSQHLQRRFLLLLELLRLHRLEAILPLALVDLLGQPVPDD